ncbi:hypothetical protein KSF73_16190 [Burkholderiaceae bacterium DAT-1]|nr:hypothetical protein [Burkholderiaceae bacterium DAT-1]
MITAATAILYGCGGGGGGGSTPIPTPTPVPPPASVTIDVFGARGGSLTAVVTSANCAATPSISWKDASGAVLGSGASIDDSSPNVAVTAVASCSTATASETLVAQNVFASTSAFAVLNSGTATAWGSTVWGGQTTAAEAIKNIAQIVPSERGFAALLQDGSVRAWGSSIIAVTDPEKVSSATSSLTGIARLIAGRTAYFGIKSDGSFVAWGAYRELNQDGNFVNLNDAKKGLTASKIAALKNVVSIASTEGAYAALLSDQTVVPFGDPEAGGEFTAWSATPTGVQQIVGTNYDFIAIYNKDTEHPGSVVGADPNGAFGWASGTDALVNVRSITANGFVGAALDATGKVTAFGYANDVEAADSSSLADKLVNVKSVKATQTAFAALRSDGVVVSWGDSQRMGSSLAAVQSSLTGVSALYSTDYAFAALKSDGTVVTWGDANTGGDSSAVTSKLTGVLNIVANKYSFAALKSDGTVVTWGVASKGGDSSSVSAQLTGVRAIYATSLGGYIAIKKDGSFVTWGDKWAGGGSTPASLTTIPYHA